MLKKGKIIIMVLAMLLVISCTGNINDNTGWLRNKGFAGQAKVVTDNHGTIEEKELPQIVIKFDAKGGYELYNMEAKGELKHTYTSSTCRITGVVASNGTDFNLDIEIRQLPNRKIEYREKMAPVTDSDYVRTVDAVLNEIM